LVEFGERHIKDHCKEVSWRKKEETLSLVSNAKKSLKGRRKKLEEKNRKKEMFWEEKRSRYQKKEVYRKRYYLHLFSFYHIKY